MVIEGIRGYISKANPSCKFHPPRSFELTADTNRFHDKVKAFFAMGKLKSSAVKATKDTEVKPKSSVKHGAITKSSQTPKSKSKQIAKQVALKVEKTTKGDKKSKKSKKEPTPPPEPSSSESDEESASSPSSDDESEAEVEAPKVATKPNGVKANGGPKAAAKVEAESSDSSASSESSDSDDDEVEAKTVPKPAPADGNTNGAAKASSDSEDDSEEDSDDSEDSEDEVEAVPKAEAKKVLNGTPEKASAEVCNSYRRLVCPIQYQNLIFFRPHLTKIPRIPAHPSPTLKRNPTKRLRKLLFRRNARLIPRLSLPQRNQRLQKPARLAASLTCLLVNYPGTLMRIGSPESLANTESLLALKSLRTRRQAALKGLHHQ